MSGTRRPRPLLLNIWIADELMGALLDKNLRADGVEPFAYGTLSVIGAFGPITPSELAERTGAPLTTLSDRVRRLVDSGDVERVPNPDDGRSHLLQVTKRGDKRWHDGWGALQQTIQEISSGLELPLDEVQDALDDLIAATRKALTGA